MLDDVETLHKEILKTKFNKSIISRKKTFDESEPNEYLVLDNEMEIEYTANINAIIKNRFF